MKPLSILKTVCSVLLVIAAIGMVRPVVTRAASVIKYAQPVTGTLAASQRVEYTFDGNAGDRVDIQMTVTDGNVNPYVMLYSPDGVLVAEDDNSLGKDDAHIQGVVLQAAGSYKVIAANTNGQDGGKFSLIVLRATAKGVIYYDGTPNGKEAYQLSRPINHTDVTYVVLNTQPGFSSDEVKSIIRQAFQAWADVTPLTFREVSSNNADLNIQFSPIDGQYNVLGETCPPSSPCAGDIQFDSDEPWVMGAPNSDGEISFLAVASHEFGHAIGLLHSNDASALMYPSYSPYNLRPGPDDIAGAQRLYGAGKGSVENPPNAPGPSSGGDSTPEVTGTLSNDTFVNFWDFDVQAGEAVTISMQRTSGNLDSFLVVIDKNNNILAYDDDGGGDRNAVLRNLHFPQAGTYTVAATRADQAQGHTQGNYKLDIQYGETPNTGAGNIPAATTAPNNPPSAGGQGSVQASKADASVLQKTETLDSALDKPFVETTSPETETRNAVVFREQSYTWLTTWCAKDAQTLQKNLQDMTITFAINGNPVDQNAVTLSQPQTQDNLTCVVWYTVLSNWSGSSMQLTRKMTFRNPVYDGMTIYAAGDYIDTFNVQVR